MAVNFLDATLDLGLDAAIGDLITRVDLCTGEPANYAAVAGVSVANYTGLTSGSFTKANGDVSGRKITLGALTGNNATASGTATHLAFSDGTTLYAVLTVTSQAVTSGNPVTINAVDVLEIRDVVAA
ncbi:MAG: hypothetical protein Rubg2KO_15650 [Rubricoccaceae bacterium]